MEPSLKVVNLAHHPGSPDRELTFGKLVHSGGHHITFIRIDTEWVSDVLSSIVLFYLSSIYQKHWCW